MANNIFFKSIYNLFYGEEKEQIVALLTEYKSQFDELKTELADTKKDLNESKKRIDEFEESLNIQKTNNDVLETRIKELEDKLYQQEIMNQSQKQELVAIKSQQLKLSTELDSQNGGGLQDSKYKQSCLEELLTNPGYFHFTITIYRHLNYVALANLSIVSKSINAVIVNSKIWWGLHIEKIICTRKIFLVKHNDYDIYGRSYLLEKFPWYLEFLEYVMINGSFNAIKIIITLLKLYFCDKNIEGNGGITPLFYAIMNNSTIFVEQFLKSPIKYKDTEENYIKTVCNFDTTPFTYACENNHWESVKLFVENIKTQSFDFRHGLPLHRASQIGHHKVVEYLLKLKGFDITVRNHNGKTALELAKENNHEEVVGIFAVYELRTFLHKVFKEHHPDYISLKYGRSKLLKMNLLKLNTP